MWTWKLFLSIFSVLSHCAKAEPEPQYNQNQNSYQQQQGPGFQAQGFGANAQYNPAPYPYAQPYQSPPPQDLDQPYPQQQRFQQSPQDQQQSTTRRYPLTPPSVRYRIGAISDLDKAAKLDDKNWVAYLKEGYLSVLPNHDGSTNITVEWDNRDNKSERAIKSGYSYAGRGMELSILNVFNGKVYSCDDKSGIVFELPLKAGEDGDIVPIPWVILADGNFTGPNGFKCEWATVKDGDLWIGGHGKHVYNKKGEIVHSGDRFVKKVTTKGEVTHLDWSEYFDKMAEALDIHGPGYVTHEAAGWSDILNKWIFMPRKVSKEAYDSLRDETQGSDIALIADEEFNKIDVIHVGELIPAEGFSSFKFVPGTEDEIIIALKSIETEKEIKTLITAFDLKGNVLLEEQILAEQKYEGIEFL